ncbi:hypothetical protein LIER_34056 [Lithospermum erythrorhizon]|uniref:Secreted protein n=1 Tax=Lithospermum erythrorhizon TaxID=34254 RepID=A0AAV3RYK2_LITER
MGRGKLVVQRTWLMYILPWMWRLWVLLRAWRVLMVRIRERGNMWFARVPLRGAEGPYPPWCLHEDYVLERTWALWSL